MPEQPIIRVIGGGLAGTEAAWQTAKFGLRVDLYEMRPVRKTAAHTTGNLAELVCSNSLKSNDTNHAPGLLKEEMRILDSLILRAADRSSVPAGMSLSVDREAFASFIQQELERLPNIRIRREEVVAIPSDGVNIIATGPLTSESMAASIRDFTQSPYLYYYDALSPIVEVDSIDRSVVFAASRYGKGEGDYLNCPMNREEYDSFYEALTAAEVHPLKDFEKAVFFEGCLPIEELARRGRDTLRFGPMKPVGLTDPRTGRRPYAVLQLRQDNLAASHYNMVGFQTSMKFSEQARVFRLIPGLQSGEFIRYGWIHRNTYLNAPAILTETYQARSNPALFFAGQLSGVEGYVDSAASGLLAGVNAARFALGLPARVPPPSTAIGALAHYISHADAKHFQPMNITFGLIVAQEIQSFRDKQRKKELLVKQALEAIREFAASIPARPERIAR
ncbi:MAG TPA: methylenetetrahydrofolate--tRNA-(uracil(54)-C(5))-methyltransferase (FADH(2)-oxidizing) TrmFO [Acidobacteriota bacterium]|nr:methylenetetrahydrofolate--tRNA-(uracil(54)-C(5))-methyltransferase (FADH(2)-oxidizing) TrmFO [Acidobacteriota bacterium]